METQMGRAETLSLEHLEGMYLDNGCLGGQISENTDQTQNLKPNASHWEARPLKFYDESTRLDPRIPS